MKTSHPSLNNGIDDGTPCDPMRPPSPAPEPVTEPRTPKQEMTDAERIKAAHIMETPPPAPVTEPGHFTINDLRFSDLRDVNVRRCEAVFHPLNSWTPAEWAVAMAGEVGEACNFIKKLRRLDDGTNTAKDPQTREECIENVAKELADTIIYADLLAARLGINLAVAVREKFNEVSKRMNSKEAL